MHSETYRWQLLARFIGLFMVMSGLTRLGLLVFNGDFSLIKPTILFQVFGLGTLYDFAVALWWSMPLALLYCCWSTKGKLLKGLPYVSIVISFLLILGHMFVSMAEFVFWNEFASRFNFIAVDYLIYSREVLGNIRESYDVSVVLLPTVALAVIVAVIMIGPQRRLATTGASSFRLRAMLFVAFAAAASGATAWVDTRWKEVLVQPQRAQLAGNGPWEFLHAFRFNQIDYEQHYRMLPWDQADSIVQGEWRERKGYRLTGSKSMPIEREVIPTSPPRDINIVLVSIESLGAEFVESLGGKPGLTPNLERLGREGLYFTQLYATGTRTVRGLEALTLSVPPTPGHAIPMRPHHVGLFTLGGVLKEKGYVPIYIYGGYSYFDNMKSFFAGNGYSVIDRTALDRKDITHENIWGVADEDLFKLAVREIDARVTRGKRVFAHIMTTSNHRPFTYPAGRIDIAPGAGREGAVKYTDYAIGKFVEEAKTKPWFNQTIFIFVADHTSIARGQTDLPMEKYHIPMVIYAPSFISPRIVNWVTSQIDVAPTILGLVNLPYVSQFFGRDVLHDGPDDAHVFLGNYQTVGLIDDGVVVELKPRRYVGVFENGTRTIAHGEAAEEALNEAIATYQVAADRFSGKSDGAKRVQKLGVMP